MEIVQHGDLQSERFSVLQQLLLRSLVIWLLFTSVIMYKVTFLKYFGINGYPIITWLLVTHYPSLHIQVAKWELVIPQMQKAEKQIASIW